MFRRMNKSGSLNDAELERDYSNANQWSCHRTSSQDKVCVCPFSLYRCNVDALCSDSTLPPHSAEKISVKHQMS